MIGVIAGFFIQFAGAQTWSTAKRLTWVPGISSYPSVVVDSSDRIHVVWNDYAPGQEEIFYKRSTNGGASWSSSKRLSWSDGIGSVPSIAADSSNGLHVVWTTYIPGAAEIFYRKSTDGGVTWQASKRLTWTSGVSLHPKIVSGLSGWVHVVWYDDTPGNYELYYQRSTNGGTTWQAIKRLTWSSVDSVWQSVAVDSGGGIHIVWVEGNQGEWPLHEIYYKRSINGGSVWQATKRLTWNNSSSSSPRITIGSGSEIHVSFTDSAAGNAELYYKKSTDVGGTWGPSKRLTWNSGPSDNSYIAVDSSNRVHVAWEDWVSGNWEILYRRSTNGGTAWQTTKRLTWTPMESYAPSMGIDTSDGIHLVWYDLNPGNHEIFYKKGTQ